MQNEEKMLEDEEIPYRFTTEELNTYIVVSTMQNYHYRALLFKVGMKGVQDVDYQPKWVSNATLRKMLKKPE